MAEVQGQLQQAEETQRADKAERRQLRERLEERERELERARELSRRADEGSGEKEAELGRVHACLQALETDNREQVSLVTAENDVKVCLSDAHIHVSQEVIHIVHVHVHVTK